MNSLKHGGFGNFLMTWDAATSDAATEIPANPRPVGKGLKCESPRKSYRSHRARLRSVADVTAEVAKLYREARIGKVDTQDASRLANMLSIVARLLTDSELEARIAALEAGSSK